MRWITLFAGCMFMLSLSTGVAAQKKKDSDIKKALSELDSLRNCYLKKLKDLDSRISAIEKARKEEKEKAEMEALLNAASDLSRTKKKEEATISRVFRGGQRQLQALNPNISMTGDFFGSVSSGKSDVIVNDGDFTDGRNMFYMREAEFHIIAPLDPFTRGKFFLGIPGVGEYPLSFMIGEAYMEWLNLPANMNLKIGLFNTQFGILNRWHDHGLPQVDRPRVLTNLFSKNNFAGIGVGANFLLPRLWAHVNELDIEIVTGGDGVSFDDANDNVIFVTHLKNYYDLSRDAYIEIGFSGANGYNDKKAGYRTTLVGLDITYKWAPVDRAHYRTVEFRNEFFYSHRNRKDGAIDRFGFYSYISNKLGRRFWIGIRAGYSELPTVVNKEYEWDITPYVDFWQSEFVMMRFQYSYTYRSYEENDHTFFIQTVWSMGPHKHEAY